MPRGRQAARYERGSPLLCPSVAAVGRALKPEVLWEFGFTQGARLCAAHLLVYPELSKIGDLLTG
jgi:hypothetical protein